MKPSGKRRTQKKTIGVSSAVSFGGEGEERRGSVVAPQSPARVGAGREASDAQVGSEMGLERRLCEPEVDVVVRLGVRVVLGCRGRDREAHRDEVGEEEGDDDVGVLPEGGAEDL